MTPLPTTDQALAAAVSKLLSVFGTSVPQAPVGPPAGIIPHSGMNIPGAGQ